MSDFDDIRPYNDDEVHSVLLRLLADNEFVDAIVRLKSPLMSRLAAGLARPLARRALHKELAGVTTVEGFQAKIENYLQKNIDETTTSLTTSGLELLDKSRPYLFISNHRDIAMDPAFVNWILFQNGFQTLRIAIGDNLLTKPFASDLMRLNKCFVVNRSATAPREKFKAAKQLSAYIHHSLVDDQANIWIAQREGRAKDSLDISNPAIISMLALNKPKADDFGDYMARLNIVPVSISYELDPCDTMKARELTLTAEQGAYQKAEHEDVRSIAQGITGQKNGVHVAFGQPFGADLTSVEDVANRLNRCIAAGYVLHPTNCIAHEIIHGRAPAVNVGAHAKPYVPAEHSEAKKHFEARLRACPEAFREQFLNIYANPVQAQLDIGSLQSSADAS
ncbi:1-acyl-sn-glycerol-3-phosphate acyltransferase [Marinagarivorans algicola]|uniref:1-acyl-sn-glycerol-3-phosphate acyltransferase n=1 Tax=Marinagarivorans algicola TaxID=1513270 RepID=UPI0006B94BE9|nr:1-acyl-sn-glycerol-3-phosphate acyltransferase [Marinagarivorans algicola]